MTAGSGPYQVQQYWHRVLIFYRKNLSVQIFRAIDSLIMTILIKILTLTPCMSVIINFGTKYR